MGPQWVASVVNAVGESPEWRSTAIVIVWDDWGGFYDNVPPPRYGFESLGFRVPCLIVSPYARQHYVSHTQYEFGSILKFIEENWKLGSLGATDVRAASIADSFDFTAPPRAYKPIKGIVPRSYFENERPSYQPVDNE
jgi:phospholipase C